MDFLGSHRTLRRLRTWRTTGALLSVAGFASAEPRSTNAAAAQALYDEARALVEQADFARACPKFKASYDLDPGGGTLLNLALCYEEHGKLALAWSTFKEALAVARRDRRQDRAEFATAHIESLEQRLGKVTVSVALAARVPGLRVLLDGEILDEAAWDVRIPVDPGEHHVVAEAPGKQAFRATLLVRAGAGKIEHHVSIPALADVVPATPVKGPAVVARASDLRPPELDQTTVGRDVGWVVGGAGAAAMGLGSYFGIRAFSRWDDRNDDCRGGCSKTGEEAASDASRAAMLANIGVGVGAAAVGVGLYLVLSNPDRNVNEQVHSGSPVSVVVGRGTAGIALRSRW